MQINVLLLSATQHLSSIMADDSHIESKPHRLPKRKRAARILILGWLFFWVIGLLQPCPVALAGVLRHDSAIAHPLSANAYALGSSDTGRHDSSCCVRLSATGTAVSGQFGFVPTTTDYSQYVAIATYSVPALAPPVTSESFFPYHPASPPRAFLRDRRLLI